MKAHKRGANYKPTTTVVFDDTILVNVESYQKRKRKDNRSQAINELVALGLKYAELVEKKKREKNRVSSLA